MKNKLLFTSLFTLLASCSYGAVYTDKNGKSTSYMTDAERRSGIQLMTTQYDWQKGFWEEMSVTGKLHTCATKDPKKGMLGFDAYLKEPLYIADAVANNNEVPSLGIELGSWRPDKTGLLTKNSGMYINVFKFPVAGIVLKDKSGGIFTFEEGNPKIIYLAVIDPKKWWDILNFDLNPERGIFATVFGAVASAGSCVANTTLDKLSGHQKREGSAGKQLRSIIDGMYYSMGCSGSVPMGSIPTNEDPIMSAKLGFGHTLYEMHSKRGIVSALEVGHTTLNVLNGYDEDIRCRPSRRFVPPMTQYTLQLVSPTVGEDGELGISAIEHSFKNGVGNWKRVIWIASQRRDYVALASQGAPEDGPSAAQK